MTRQILVPVNDSDPATTAMEFAVDNYPEETIIAIHVIDPSDLPSGGFEAGTVTDFERFHEEHQERGEELLERETETAVEAGADVETVIETGRPAQTIVSYTEEHDIDHIVIGSHGRTGASRILLGSVAESVTRRSPVPVTIVR